MLPESALDFRQDGERSAVAKHARQRIADVGRIAVGQRVRRFLPLRGRRRLAHFAALLRPSIRVQAASACVARVTLRRRPRAPRIAVRVSSLGFPFADSVR